MSIDYGFVPEKPIVSTTLTPEDENEMSLRPQTFHFHPQE